MPFVKLDTNILNSTLWFEKVCRDIFLTALLMAEPVERDEPEQQIEIRTLNETGWTVPPGKYGFVPAASVGIIRRAIIEDEEKGLDALEKLGSPEEGSRTAEFEGRRLVRVDGGFIVLNYFKYRDQDYTAAARSKRYRERKKAAESHAVAPLPNGVTGRNITHAEAESIEQIAEAETDKETRVPVSNWLTEDDLWLELQRILPQPEIEKHIGLWIKRIKENRRAMYEAVCDYKDKRNKRSIKNPAAWLTQRYQHFNHLSPQETKSPNDSE